MNFKIIEFKLKFAGYMLNLIKCLLFWILKNHRAYNSISLKILRVWKIRKDRKLESFYKWFDIDESYALYILGFCFCRLKCCQFFKWIWWVQWSMMEHRTQGSWVLGQWPKDCLLISTIVVTWCCNVVSFDIELYVHCLSPPSCKWKLAYTGG